ncbi:phosphatase PAP2 family protein [Natronorubrum aibiense]|uniref:Phosphatase PAP2 family protein n=1 Tax=Natronorubrum aibiense TaxID=348826 RepID=A0A5P9NZI2_9EURY|nr:phosphatase PAP2 family protein [Natronorubrum aibiense]QFU81318.1 phosphatase PAP2 family protein [Natronorubrum aibiense]
MRFEAESELVREAVSAEYAEFVIAITELGGVTALMGILALLFWWGDRRQSALVISYAIAGLAVLLAVKTAFALPRPPEDAMLVALEDEREGYGFPSGHAFAATVVYGGLLSMSDRAREPWTVVGVVALVVAVSLSRVVLGVHYLGDVIVGMLLGVGFVVAMNRLTRGVPAVGFAVALVLAVPALAITGVSEDTVLAVGGALGGLLTAGRIDRLPALRSRLEGVALAAVGGSGIVVLQVAESVVDATLALGVLYAALVAWIFVVPTVVGRVGDRLVDSSVDNRRSRRPTEE